MAIVEILARWRATPAAVRLPVSAAAIGAAWYATAHVGLALGLPDEGVGVIHPLHALALATFLLTPRRTWPLYLAALVAAHLAAQARFGRPGPYALALLITLCLQEAAAALAVRRSTGRPQLDTVHDLSWYLLFAVVLFPALGAAATTGLHRAANPGVELWGTWEVRYLAIALAHLTLTPGLLFWGTRLARAPLPSSPRRYVEALLLAAGLGAVAATVLGFGRTRADLLPALFYGPQPFLLWAAVRFGAGGLGLALPAVALLTIASAAAGHGLFAAGVPAASALSLQVLLVAMSLPLMFLGALVQERRRSESALRDSQRRYTLATSAGGVGVWDWNLLTGELYVDPSLKAALGYADDEIPNRADEWRRHVHSGDAEQIGRSVQAHLEGRTPHFEVEHRLVHRDGSVRWFLARGMVIERRGGQAARMIGTETDVTARRRAEEALRHSSEQVRVLAGRLLSAQEEECRRLARELHDDLNQRVAALAIAVSAARRRMSRAPDASPDSLLRELDQLQRQTGDLATAIRDLSHHLHPATLEHAGLVAALRALAADFGRLEQLTVGLVTPDEMPGLPRDVTLCLYRVAQESVRNVARHAGTRRADVTLAVRGDTVEMVVQDAGRGFEVQRGARNGGLGLVSIEERVRLLRGTLRITSSPGRGTRILVRLPLAGGP